MQSTRCWLCRHANTIRMIHAVKPHSLDRTSESFYQKNAPLEIYLPDISWYHTFVFLPWLIATMNHKIERSHRSNASCLVATGNTIGCIRVNLKCRCIESMIYNIKGNMWSSVVLSFNLIWAAAHEITSSILVTETTFTLYLQLNELT